MTHWIHFPLDPTPYDYPGEALHEHWQRLHAGDREPWPDAARIETLLAMAPAVECPAEAAGSEAALQDAWRRFHRGEFEAAVERARALGLAGFAVIAKATVIYADQLETDEQRQMEFYARVAERQETVRELLPDEANAHYFHALALGRYAQTISIMRALREGYAGRVRESLDRALELEPDHGDAHLALGMYHAEIIGKVGKLVGGMTYAADADSARRHLQRARELNPGSPTVLVEYGNGLDALPGKGGLEDAWAAYREAAAATPADAMEALDREYARQELGEA